MSTRRKRLTRLLCRRRRAPESVMGVRAAAPRPTPLALWLVLRHVAAPLLAGLVAFDVVVWAIGRYLFDACLAVWCWF